MLHPEKKKGRGTQKDGVWRRVFLIPHFPRTAENRNSLKCFVTSKTPTRFWDNPDSGGSEGFGKTPEKTLRHPAKWLSKAPQSLTALFFYRNHARIRHCLRKPRYMARIKNYQRF